jgi:hypothetical protein
VEDQELFHESLRVLKDIRAGLPRDAHDRAAERLDEAIDLLQRAMDGTHAISKRDLLKVLSKVIGAFTRIAALSEAIIRIVRSF